MGSRSDLLRTVTGVNDRQWQLTIRALKDRFASNLQGLTVAKLGLVFNPGTGDLTEAPAVKLADAFASEGAQLTTYDPSHWGASKAALPIEMQMAPDVLSATTGAQASVVMPQWSEIIEAAWAAVSLAIAPPRFIFDGRNALNSQRMISLGFEHVGVGLGVMLRSKGRH